jgi:hypothetical protein
MGKKSGFSPSGGTRSQLRDEIERGNPDQRWQQIYGDSTLGPGYEGGSQVDFGPDQLTQNAGENIYAYWARQNAHVAEQTQRMQEYLSRPQEKAPPVDFLSRAGIDLEAIKAPTGSSPPARQPQAYTNPFTLASAAPAPSGGLTEMAKALRASASTSDSSGE